MQPEKYEVIRLTNDMEVVCMSIEQEETVIAVIPMICYLNPDEDVTKVSFQPYCVITDDIYTTIKKEHIMHRNNLNPKFIDLYDAASSKWVEMVEQDSIPVDTTVSGITTEEEYEEVEEEETTTKTYH